VTQIECPSEQTGEHGTRPQTNRASRPQPAQQSQERGVSSVVDSSLLIAISLFAFAGLGVAGLAAVDTTQSTVTNEAIAGELAVMDGEIDTLRRTDQQQETLVFEIDQLRQQSSANPSGEVVDGQIITVPDGGPQVGLTIGGTDQLSGVPESDPAQVGQVQYIEGQQKIVYQNGAVFSTLPGGGTNIVSRPPIELSTPVGSSEKLVYLPVTAISPADGIETLNREVIISENFTEPIYQQRYLPDSESLTYRVESEFAPGWERIFRDEFGTANWATVTRVDDTTVELTIAPGHGGVYVSSAYTKVRTSG